MTEYFLPSHVHFCSRGQDFVFLDLRQDDYTLVDGRGAEAFKALLLAGQMGEVVPESPDALRELLESGLLITDRTKGKGIRATRTELALESLIDIESAPRTRLSTLHVCRFIAACANAAIKLRCNRIEEIVTAVELRKAHRSGQRPFDMNKARDLTAVFNTLRALFPRDYLCIYDSLALLDFLARYGVSPTWVFGVRLEPWAAHCWVQEGQYVFNEGVEEAAGYTPIMAI